MPRPKPDAPGADPNGRAIARADALAAVGRHRDAVTLLRGALGEAPDEPRLLGKLAVCHLALGEAAFARGAAEAMIRVRPDDEWGHRILAVAAGLQGDQGQRLASAREARRLAPEEPDPLPVLIPALLDGGRRNLDEAEEASETLLRLAPDSEDSHRLAAEVAIRRKSWATAERHARRAVALHPDDTAALVVLADVQFRGGGRRQQLEALETLHRALQLDPQNAAVRRFLLALVDIRFRVPVGWYAAIGLIFPAVYLWAILELLYKGLFAPLRMRSLSPPLRETIRQRLRLCRLRSLLLAALFLAGTALAACLLTALVSPGAAARWTFWAWLLGALLAGGFAGLRLHRLERMRSPYL